MRLIEVKNYEEMSVRAARIIAAQVILRPDSVLGLATGSTPEGAYRYLSDWCERGQLDFQQVRTVNLDEYIGLSGENVNSYRYFMEQHLFRHINIERKNTQVPDGRAADIAEECRRYETIISAYGGIELQLLGLGHDGHIGFNEPADHFEMETHAVRLAEQTIQANSRLFDGESQVPREAITMGIRAIMQARRILLLVSGKDKAEILKRALCGPVTPEVPASILQMHGDLTVIADVEAMSAMNR